MGVGEAEHELAVESHGFLCGPQAQLGLPGRAAGDGEVLQRHGLAIEVDSFVFLGHNAPRFGTGPQRWPT